MTGMVAVPITAETPAKAIADIKEANKKADAIELRLDFLQEKSESSLKELLEECRKPVIATFRDQNYGVSAGAIKRLSLLKKAIKLGVAYVDLDFNSDKGFLEEIRKNKGNTGLILSFHDFKKTPGKQELLQLAELMVSAGADIIKVVTYANCDKDNDTVLSMIHAAKKLGKPVIAFCMGPKGKRSRMQCIKQGSFLSFACLSKGKESAEGQLTLEELRKISR